MSRVGTRLELRVDAVAHGGWCVARHEDQVVFVRHALPGELVQAQVTEETKRFLRADAVDVVEPSADRVTPPCPFAGPGKCGGCDWQHASLEGQRRLKGQVLTEQLRRIAGIERDVEVEELPGASDGLGWRTRVRYAVAGDGTAGLRRHRSHEIEPVDECRIAHPEARRLNVPQLNWPGVAEVETVVSGSTSDRAVVVTPRAAKLPRLPRLPVGASVLRRFRGGRTQQVQGRRGVREMAAGRQWRTSASSFWQVHPAAAETLAVAVRTATAPLPGETVLDLYCGVGLFAGVLGDEVGPQGRVLGVESHPAAVRDARHNLQDLPQVRIEQSDVPAKLREWNDLRADLAVVDPPRTGLGDGVVAALAELRPSRIAYVSCDPATLARDLGRFHEVGYRLGELRAFDAFPMTHHLECVALLNRGGSASGDAAL
ncbi:class I SAM-dependent RNA methyltransferase [Lipingzhangella sp. LS1_29]|uniref:Class I SAM-dependent RNA methyltransferase n=1 Tax=Lipingzhangella rawalii TaxID=2055835 RepID=A0ABU2H0J4_9ACTN|nr:class I SAM-dependent RNA methyltransferase [Lipingzhangella rawalii]MDS1268833.1 class I SAM-dependent RNA methyltransferase [Lipingzhangella rawalii]